MVSACYETDERQETDNSKKMDEDREKPLTVFVSFPSLYTQSLINKALVSTLPNLSLSPGPFPEDSTPTLQWSIPLSSP